VTSRWQQRVAGADNADEADDEAFVPGTTAEADGEAGGWSWCQCQIAESRRRHEQQSGRCDIGGCGVLAEGGAADICTAHPAPCSQVLQRSLGQLPLWFCISSAISAASKF
jgi:hypothetical protein